MNPKQLYLGLKGDTLIWTMIMTVVFPAYFVMGYNNAVIGGLLTLDTFVSVFPSIDTVHTEGAQEQQAARVQGMPRKVCFHLAPC